MILVDAHVHIYDCFDLKKFFDSAYSNFNSVANKLKAGKDFTGVLLLTETSKDNWFQKLSKFADGKDLPADKKAGKWKLYHTNESYSLLAKSENEKNLILIAGRQVVTAEGLEVLALIIDRNLKDGTSIEQLIKKIKSHYGLPVFPWGFGKWIGRRGKVLKALVETAKNSDFFLGDNGGRPGFMHRPSLFKLSDQKGIRILPGTDPLPLKTDNVRAGSFGFGLINSMSVDKPGKDLSKYLLDPTTKFEYFGRLQQTYTFIRNQVRLRVKLESID